MALLSPAVPGLALPSCMFAHSSALRDPAGPLGRKERENVMKLDQQNECGLQSGFPVPPVLFSEFSFTVSPFLFSFSPEHVFSFSASGFCVCPSSKALPTFFLSLEPQPFPLKCFFFFLFQISGFLALWLGIHGTHLGSVCFSGFGPHSHLRLSNTVVPLMHMTLGAQFPFPWG